MPNFAYKVFNNGNERLLAISDAGIVGKNLDYNGLSINVSKEFYAEKFCNEKDVSKLASSATMVNAIGKDIINLLSKKGLIEDKCILLLGDIPHVQIISIK